MINIGLYYKVKSGHGKEFERIFEEVVRIFSGARGMRGAKLYREVGSDEYLIYSEWEDMNSFSGFVRSDEFKKVTGLGKEIIEGTPRHRVFAEMDLKGGH